MRFSTQKNLRCSTEINNKKIYVNVLRFKMQRKDNKRFYEKTYIRCLKDTTHD